ncbi:hypothetical protein EVAR_70674_1 [Eumeta japonica]|uniref:Uncharacterized protein n=1 Tax=Eumeta variegata TaxID=151549 RepID=A0A4C1SUZ8_EUMVA|nr:hypothetical protein EVAR_70674_1 [Eumeta japonica]
MQKRSEAKQRKMQSMVALSAGAMSGMAGHAAGIGVIEEKILKTKVETTEVKTRYNRHSKKYSGSGQSNPLAQAAEIINGAFVDAVNEQRRQSEAKGNKETKPDSGEVEKVNVPVVLHLIPMRNLPLIKCSKCWTIKNWPICVNAPP